MVSLLSAQPPPCSQGTRDFCSPCKAPLAWVLSDSPVAVNFSFKQLLHFCWNPLSSQCDARTFHIIFFESSEPPGAPSGIFTEGRWGAETGQWEAVLDVTPSAPHCPHSLPPPSGDCPLSLRISVCMSKAHAATFICLNLSELSWFLSLVVKMTAFYKFGRSRLLLQ